VQYVGYIIICALTFDINFVWKNKKSRLQR